MPRIHLTSCIHAPAERVFDLSRSTSVHKTVLRTYRNGRLDGATDGMIGLKDKVTFSLTFMGRQRVVETRIEELNPPTEMTSVLVKGRGSFVALRHEQHFKAIDNGTLLIDLLEYEVAFGALGRMIDNLLIKKFLKKYLEKKNGAVKQYAESDKWKVALAPRTGNPQTGSPSPQVQKPV